MKKIVDDETKTIWYFSESGFPTYLAISVYRKSNPSYTHSIASKEYWERLCETNKPSKLWVIRNNFNAPDEKSINAYEQVKVKLCERYAKF